MDRYSPTTASDDGLDGNVLSADASLACAIGSTGLDTQLSAETPVAEPSAESMVSESPISTCSEESCRGVLKIGAGLTPQQTQQRLIPQQTQPSWLNFQQTHQSLLLQLLNDLP